MKRISGLVVVLVTLALGAAACGGGGASASGGANTAKKRVHTAGSATPSATVMVADSSLGKILVDTNGRTLYAFDHDTPTMSACTDACANLWPALVVSGAPHAGAGIDTAKLGVLTVPAGSQVTYAGHPLYTFANDHAAGDVTGEGIGGVWWVVGADGEKIATAAATPTTPTPTTAAPPTAPPATSAQTSPPPTAAPETDPPPTSPPAPQPTAPPATQPPPTTNPYYYNY